RIIFTGFVFGSGYKTLQQNAYAYVHATEVGGTHPALIEAMGYGNCVLALNTPENSEVVGDAALLFSDTEDLSAKLEQVVGDEAVVEKYRAAGQSRVREKYSWDAITDQYEELFRKLTERLGR
ncbi:MAG: glycosyltransferase, partial [Acidobacteria bacterium]|nr:glycosyltransferase [Acidobacteriota bacterium]